MKSLCKKMLNYLHISIRSCTFIFASVAINPHNVKGKVSELRIFTLRSILPVLDNFFIRVVLLYSFRLTWREKKKTVAEFHWELMNFTELTKVYYNKYLCYCSFLLRVHKFLHSSRSLHKHTYNKIDIFCCCCCFCSLSSVYFIFRNAFKSILL